MVMLRRGRDDGGVEAPGEFAVMGESRDRELGCNSIPRVGDGIYDPH
jgi:hypothetical protein